jgi:hypothetical protein
MNLMKAEPLLRGGNWLKKVGCQTPGLIIILTG